MWCSFLLLTLFVTVQGRAVNISNTWVLPEEGFPVFYRYFRDRISWYEADAVCQFHHANLVTVDTTAQYDAVRAYLKELDISSAVWVGLIRSNPDGDFTWTDYRGLSGDGYWSSAPDTRSAPLCAAADPTADYRWEARACGGPSVASFICELPVPQWALGNEGCMVRALPALTVLYLPESAAVQLTADCGLAGVKRVQCTGNVVMDCFNSNCLSYCSNRKNLCVVHHASADEFMTTMTIMTKISQTKISSSSPNPTRWGRNKRDDLLKELSCGVEDLSLTTTTSIGVMLDVTSEAVFTDQEQSNEPNNIEEITNIEHDDNIYRSTTSKSIPIFQNSIIYATDKLPTKQKTKIISKIQLENTIVSDIIDNNNLHSNEIHSVLTNENEGTKKQLEKEEDEKYLEHKKMHDELARLGNFEKIFNQPTDHFVPPLVMAKAKIGDDMTVLSIEEKLAQQKADDDLAKYTSIQNNSSGTDTVNTMEASSYISSSANPLNPSLPSTKVELYVIKDSTKHTNLKKYDYKHDIVKAKVLKSANFEQMKMQKDSKYLIETTTADKETENITLLPEKNNSYDLTEDTSLELTVILKDPEINDKYNSTHSVVSENTHDPDPATTILNNGDSSTHNNIEMTDEVIKIIVVNDKHHSTAPPKVFEIATKMPVSSPPKSTPNSYIDVKSDVSTLSSKINELPSTTNFMPQTLVATATKTSLTYEENSNVMSTKAVIINDIYSNFTYTNDKNSTDDVTLSSIIENAEFINKTDFSDLLDMNVTYAETTVANTTSDIDDFQSPLLSAANEPLHKPIRSRRPQASQNRANKFNPFRILG